MSASNQVNEEIALDDIGRREATKSVDGVEVEAREASQSNGEPQAAVEEPSSPPSKRPIAKLGLASLLALHASTSWNARTAEFSFYLFLVVLFPDTLLLASIYGFAATGVSILFAGSVGALVDKIPRLRIVRVFTCAQKASIIAACAAFLGLFIGIKPVSNYREAPPAAWAAAAIVMVFGCTMSLANIGTSVAIERDWVTTIALEYSEETLTRLNTYMRRIDLLCKLLAPLFISLLSTTVSYTFAVAFQMGFAIVTLLFELWFAQVVYGKFEALHKPRVTEDKSALDTSDTQRLRTQATGAMNPKAVLSKITSRFIRFATDWKEFANMPVFASSVSISLLYLTVLSFDGTMLSYLKARKYNDAFIAGQRGICVVTGLLGTIIMPWMERKIGLIRAGAWSITSEALCLVPVLATFYFAMPPAAGGPAWSAALLFGGMAASRIGLWAFDLCQLKELQLALNHHPKRNRIMGLQFSMQNIADLVKYIITIILSQPSQFKWAALASFISVVLGMCVYALYVKLERKHLFHPERIPLFNRKRL